jgi:hypothetical protein
MTPAPAIERTLQPELLDTLPVHDAEAQRSRRDLRRINRIMHSAGLIAGLLRRHVPAPPGRILELGAGDGTLMRALAARLGAEWPGVTVTLLDRQRLVTDETLFDIRWHGWRAEVVCEDALTWLRHAQAPHYEVTLANLFIHHFSSLEISALFSALSWRSDCFIACEPRRGNAALWGSRCLGLLGANAVTRHDAVVSVKAGFAGEELSPLWPQVPGRWQLEERSAGPFSHCFAARRSI